MKVILLVLLVFISTVSLGQIIELITSEDIPGIQVVKCDTFTGKELSRYSRNQADLCFEYGFKKLITCDYAFQDDKARLEVFVMEDAPSAYGIYSLSIKGCNLWNLYSTFSCFNANQVSAAFGPYFLNAINLSKTKSGQGLCDQIIQVVISKNPQDSWYLPPLFQSPQLSPFINTLKYTEGPIGVANGTPMLANLLENLVFNCYSVTINTPANRGIIARIVFPDPSMLKSFIIKAGLNGATSTVPAMTGNGTYRSSYAVDDYKLIFLECTSPDMDLKDFVPKQPKSMW